MQGNFRVALPVVALLLAVGACASTPKVAGNVFDSQGPHATQVTVSYDLSYVSKADYSVPDAYSATAWLFANRQTPQPEQFLELHLPSADSESFDHGPGQTIQLGRRPFKVQTFCLAWQGGEAPKDVQPYLAMVEKAGFELSQDALIRRFIPVSNASDRDRVILVYIEDLVRYGFTCETLGAIGKPASKSARAFLEDFTLRAERSFDVLP